MKPKSTLALITLVLSLIGFTTATGAGLYKWIDKAGNVHYSQNPPEEESAKEVAPPRITSSPTTNTKAVGDEKKEDNKTGGQAKSEQLSEAQKQALDKNCQAARTNLEIYSKTQRIRQADGKIVELTEEVKQAKIKQAQEDIKKFCK